MARRARRKDQSLLKRIQQRQQRKARRENVRPLRQYFLIVCEGRETEPNYFQEFRKDLPPGLVTLKIVGRGKNTLNLLEYALQERQNKQDRAQRGDGAPYDQVWIVFDRDRFPADRFNRTVFQAQQQDIRCAYSIVAFELWLALHFELCQTANPVAHYTARLTHHLGAPYAKNDSSIYRRLQEIGDPEQAIQWAEQLYNQYDHRNPAAEDPSTTVYQLVQILKDFI
jgi:hypothetical protein